ncbi:MAG: hypothetical protein GY749_23390 [Desulfobacteraceae bacterium]|nr:hypothetical protein [Desulfobacteraceae bacterium]
MKLETWDLEQYNTMKQNNNIKIFSIILFITVLVCGCREKEPLKIGFVGEFNDRFGRDPGFAAIFGYEAAQVLFAALPESSDITELKENIIRQEVFHGLQGDFKIDKYGDPKRKIFLITIKNGQFRTLEHPSITPP